MILFGYVLSGTLVWEWPRVARRLHTNKANSIYPNTNFSSSFPTQPVQESSITPIA